MSAPFHPLQGRLLACCVLASTWASACKLYEHDLDAALSEPCVETNEPLTPAVAERVSVQSSLLLPRVRGKHASLLRWSTGQRTEIAFTLDDPDIYYVRSRINPRLPPYSDPARDTFCNGRAEIRGTLVVRTGDGQLDEKQTVVLTSRGSDEAHGLVTLDAAAIRGTYEQRPRTDERCLDRLELRVLFGADGASGTLTEVSSLRACPGGPADDADQEYGVGSWGQRPLNY